MVESLPGVQVQNFNRTTAAIGVILAFTGRKMF